MKTNTKQTKKKSNKMKQNKKGEAEEERRVKEA
jgi:hypothetical protein